MNKEASKARVEKMVRSRYISAIYDFNPKFKTEGKTNRELKDYMVKNGIKCKRINNLDGLTRKLEQGKLKVNGLAQIVTTIDKLSHLRDVIRLNITMLEAKKNLAELKAR